MQAWRRRGWGTLSVICLLLLYGRTETAGEGEPATTGVASGSQRSVGHRGEAAVRKPSALTLNEAEGKAGDPGTVAHRPRAAAAVKLTKWPAKNPRVHEKLKLLYPTDWYPVCPRQNKCQPAPCVIEGCKCVTTGGCRLGNIMVALINAVNLAESGKTIVDVGQTLFPAAPSIIAARKIGNPKLSKNRKCKKWEKISLMQFPGKANGICPLCRDHAPGMQWRAGFKTRKYLNFPPTAAKPDNETLVMHLRGEDNLSLERKVFLPEHITPPCSLYTKIADDHGYNKFMIVTSAEQSHPCIPMLLERYNNTQLVTQSAEEDWTTLSLATHLVASRSSYVTTASYVSDSLKHVFIPLNEKAGRYTASMYDLGYGGRGITLHTYLVSDYVAVWNRAAFPFVTTHPEEKVNAHRDFIV